MATVERLEPVQVGDPAPDFSLPAVHQDGTISLADYRGKTPVLVAIERGLWCPFCRRSIANLGTTSEKLRAVGVETLAIVATQLERARLYFRFRPSRVSLAADPDLTTHRAFGLPKFALTPELIEMVRPLRINPTGELPEAVPLLEATEALDRLHGFERTDVDRLDHERQFLAGPQMTGQFLIDRGGRIRWSYVECSDGPASTGRFPSEDELLAAAAAL